MVLGFSAELADTISRIDGEEEVVRTTSHWMPPNLPDTWFISDSHSATCPALPSHFSSFLWNWPTLCGNSAAFPGGVFKRPRGWCLVVLL